MDLSKPESQTRAKHSKFFKGKGEGDKDKEKDKERKSDEHEEAARLGLKAERDTSRIKAVNSEAKPVTGVVKDVGGPTGDGQVRKAYQLCLTMTSNSFLAWSSLRHRRQLPCHSFEC